MVFYPATTAQLNLRSRWSEAPIIWKADLTLTLYRRDSMYLVVIIEL